jgi:hypothetical protein
LHRTVVKQPHFTDSATYWRTRYASGGDSGAGSYGRFGGFKADVINRFVQEKKVTGVIEFGCGDGHQLSLASYPSYTGVDISDDAIHTCRAKFMNDATKTFLLASEYTGQTAELALSLDVVYHLVEDNVFEAYMARLFDAAERYVIVYSSDTDRIDGPRDPHVKHRCFSAWVVTHRPNWVRIAHIPNRYPSSGDPFTGSFADFHVYSRRDHVG